MSATLPTGILTTPLSPVRGPALPRQMPIERASTILSIFMINTYIDRLPTIVSRSGNSHLLPQRFSDIEHGLEQFLRKDILPRFDRDGLPGISAAEEARFNRYFHAAEITQGTLPDTIYQVHSEKQIFGNGNAVSTEDVIQTIRERYLKALADFEGTKASTPGSPPKRPAAPVR